MQTQLKLRYVNLMYDYLPVSERRIVLVAQCNQFQHSEPTFYKYLNGSRNIAGLQLDALIERLELCIPNKRLAELRAQAENPTDTPHQPDQAASLALAG